MIQDNHISKPTLPYETTLEDVPLSKIKLDPQQRIRQISGDYKKDPKYIALKESMIKLGQLHAITLKEDYTLLAGFYRFCVAFELGWKTIKAKIYFNISEYDEILIEIIENNNRKDFTSYEFYVALGRIKRKHENAYPETKRGRYIRSRSENEDHKSITETVSVMVSQSNISTPSFVNAHYGIFGLTDRGLRNKTRISDALENNKFDSETVDLLKQGKIVQKELLEKLRKIENRQIIKDKLGANPSPTESNSIENIHNQIKTFEDSIKKGIENRFTDAGKSHQKKVHKRDKQKRIEKPSAKDISQVPSKTEISVEINTLSEIQTKDAICSKDKDELPIKEFSYVNKDSCCYYCSHVTITRCLKCDKKCSTLKCSQGHEISFKNKCDDFTR